MSKGTDAAAAVQAADQVVLLVEPTICDHCEGVCWTVEAKAKGAMGDEGWHTVLLYLEHAALSTALATASRTLGRLGGILRQREDRQWLLEHQQRLW